MFTPEQLEQFRVEGFVVVPHFFEKDEVALMQAEIRRFQEEGLLRNVATEGDGKTASAAKANLQLCPTAPLSPAFRALPFADKVAEAIGELIGDPVVLRLDQVFLKPARHGAGTNWHQDNAYFKVQDPLRGTAMWIAVHDATVENGTMHVIPGMHTEELEHTRDGDSDHHVRCYPPEEQEVPIEMEAGGAVFFAYGVPHCTKANNSDGDRAGLAYHFVNADWVTTDMVPTDQIKYPKITGPDADGGRSDYGEDQRGKWSEMVQQTTVAAH